ncbi:anthocyanidin reductase ((2S)-flavan-3-ol-forming) isoform X1 [Gossypium hirsutum]|uniref:Anthocyanidin reductase ((2S)-flavan-3-ol-forming) isoform X1 n=2 Tax=Gossypium TaxID=3633 RepID=A0ABM3B493_GOSHI|nr:anthocyanidin reductase ((2S)-flavan-3-ol-forming)-like isoform X1 [Gossypium hirsutum]
MPGSVNVLVSQVTNNKAVYNTLRFLEELLGKVPILHVEDVCDAHIFCLEKPSINGRFLCATAYLSSAEIASHYRMIFPDIQIPDEFVEKLDRKIVWGSTKLKDAGFEFKCDVKTILEDSINLGLKLGELELPNLCIEQFNEML